MSRFNLSYRTYKDKLKKKRLYICFVDFRKAFDILNREALFYKLCKLGIRSKFFMSNCMFYIYSCASIKMVKKLSKSFDILAEPEQGHPMSPELFKIYIHDLSVKLNDIKDLNVPLLRRKTAVHG
jgi:hypothetical protein